MATYHVNCPCCTGSCGVCDMETVCISVEGIVLFGVSIGTVGITLSYLGEESGDGCDRRIFFGGSADSPVTGEFNCNQDATCETCPGHSSIGCGLTLCCQNNGTISAFLELDGDILPDSNECCQCQDIGEGLFQCPDGITECFSTLSQCCFFEAIWSASGTSADCASSVITWGASGGSSTHALTWTGATAAACSPMMMSSPKIVVPVSKKPCNKCGKKIKEIKPRTGK